MSGLQRDRRLPVARNEERCPGSGSAKPWRIRFGAGSCNSCGRTVAVDAQGHVAEHTRRRKVLRS